VFYSQEAKSLQRQFFDFFLKGTFLIKAAGRTVKATEGTWIFVPGGVAHAFHNVGTEDGHLLIQAFPGGG